MKIKNVQNLVWNDVNKTSFDCIIELYGIESAIPFTATSNDTSSHGKEIYNKGLNGDFGIIAEYIEPIMTIEDYATQARQKRDFLLKEMDVIVSNPLRWESFTPEKQTEYSAYRQALLDVPQQVDFPNSISWPIKPE